MAKKSAGTQKTGGSVNGVALLRGINVGGKNKLPMKVLVEIFATAGCGGVRTYIQSGNVVFHVPAKTWDKLAAQTTAALASGFGLKVPVVLRTAAEIERVVAANPFLGQGLDERMLHVSFLADAPAAEAVAALDPQRSAPDRFAVVGREIYMHLPNGGADTKLTNAYFDSKLKTISTVRNWNTVRTLAEMLRELPA